MTISDFIELLESDSNAERIVEKLCLSKTFVDIVKINTNNWGRASALNIHAAQYIQAVQKDVISAWNEATGQHITLSALDDHPFLIVEFEVKDGCLTIKQLIKLADTIMEGLSAKQRMCVYTMFFCGVLAVGTAYVVGKLADSGFFDSDEIKKIKLITQQKESTKVLINNLGNGTINYQGKEWDSESLRNDRKSVGLVSITENVSLDGIYIIDTCKLEGSVHLISKNGKQFYSNYDALDKSKIKILAERIATAFLEKRKIEQQLRIDAKLKNGSIIEAYIIDIDQPPRPHALNPEFKKDTTQKHTLRQGSLFDD